MKTDFENFMEIVDNCSLKTNFADNLLGQRDGCLLWFKTLPGVQMLTNIQKDHLKV